MVTQPAKSDALPARAIFRAIFETIIKICKRENESKELSFKAFKYVHV